MARLTSRETVSSKYENKCCFRIIRIIELISSPYLITILNFHGEDFNNFVTLDSDVDTVAIMMISNLPCQTNHCWADIHIRLVSERIPLHIR